MTQHPDHPVRRPVVVGVDGSSARQAAIAFAFEAASARGVDLVAVLTWRDEFGDMPVRSLLDWAGPEEEERVLLAQRLAGWTEKYPDVTVRRVVARDRPARRLLAEAGGARLVVLGSRGRGRCPDCSAGS